MLLKTVRAGTLIDVDGRDASRGICWQGEVRFPSCTNISHGIFEHNTVTW